MNSTIQEIRSVDKAEGKSELEQLAAQYNDAVMAMKAQEQLLGRAIKSRDGWAENANTHQENIRDLESKIEKLARAIDRKLGLQSKEQAR